MRRGLFGKISIVGIGLLALVVVLLIAPLHDNHPLPLNISMALAAGTGRGNSGGTFPDPSHGPYDGDTCLGYSGTYDTSSGKFDGGVDSGAGEQNVYNTPGYFLSGGNLEQLFYTRSDSYIANGIFSNLECLGQINFSKSNANLNNLAINPPAPARTKITWSPQAAFFATNSMADISGKWRLGLLYGGYSIQGVGINKSYSNLILQAYLIPLGQENNASAWQSTYDSSLKKSVPASVAAYLNQFEGKDLNATTLRNLPVAQGQPPNDASNIDPSQAGEISNAKLFFTSQPDSSEFGITAYYHKSSDAGGSGYKPGVDGPDFGKDTKYGGASHKGNPWVEVFRRNNNEGTNSNRHSQDTNREDLLAPEPFVLTDIHFSHGGLDGGDFWTWIYRNPSNPALSISYSTTNESGANTDNLVMDTDQLGTKDANNQSVDPGNDQNISGIVKYYQPGGGKLVDTNELKSCTNGAKATTDLNDPSNKNLSACVNSWNLLYTNVDTGIVKDIVNGAIGALSGVLNDAIKAVLDLISGAITGLMQQMINLVKDLLTTSYLNFFSGAGQAVQGPWGVMRTLVDILFVLVLLAIAFANTLHINLEQYSVRALLPRFIIAVIGVNFSLIIIQVLIDFGGVMVNTVLSNTSIANLTSYDMTQGSNLGSSLALIIAAIILLVGALLAVLGVVATLVARIVALWALGALAPIAFLAMVLPSTRGLFTTWWSNVVRFVAIGPLMALLLSLVVAFSKIQPIGKYGDLIKFLIVIGMLYAASIVPIMLGGRIMGAASNIGNKGTQLAKSGAGAGARAGRAGAQMGTRKAFGATTVGSGWLGQSDDGRLGGVSKRLRNTPLLGSDTRTKRALAGERLSKAREDRLKEDANRMVEGIGGVSRIAGDMEVAKQAKGRKDEAARLTTATELREAVEGYDRDPGLALAAGRQMAEFGLIGKNNEAKSDTNLLRRDVASFRRLPPDGDVTSGLKKKQPQLARLIQEGDNGSLLARVAGKLSVSDVTDLDGDALDALVDAHPNALSANLIDKSINSVSANPSAQRKLLSKFEALSPEAQEVAIKSYRNVTPEGQKLIQGKTKKTHAELLQESINLSTPPGQRQPANRFSPSGNSSSTGSGGPPPPPDPSAPPTNGGSTPPPASPGGGTSGGPPTPSSDPSGGGRSATTPSSGQAAPPPSSSSVVPPASAFTASRAAPEGPSLQEIKQVIDKRFSSLSSNLQEGLIHNYSNLSAQEQSSLQKNLSSQIASLESQGRGHLPSAQVTREALRRLTELGSSPSTGASPQAPQFNTWHVDDGENNSENEVR